MYSLHWCRATIPHNIVNVSISLPELCGYAMFEVIANHLHIPILPFSGTERCLAPRFANLANITHTLSYFLLSIEMVLVAEVVLQDT